MKAFGVGHGGQGTWLNNHFETEAEAIDFYRAEIIRTEACYRTVKNYRKTESTPEELAKAGLIARAIIVNIKKDGTTGKLRQTIQVYRIAPESRHNI